MQWDSRRLLVSFSDWNQECGSRNAVGGCSDRRNRKRSGSGQVSHRRKDRQPGRLIREVGLAMKTKQLGTQSMKMVAYMVLSLLAAPIFAQTEGNPPGRAARLSVIEGQVSFQPSGENDWSQATLNYTMTSGDRIYTYDGSRAELETGPWAVRLAEDTDLT